MVHAVYMQKCPTMADHLCELWSDRTHPPDKTLFIRTVHAEYIDFFFVIDRYNCKKEEGSEQQDKTLFDLGAMRIIASMSSFS